MAGCGRLRWAHPMRWRPDGAKGAAIRSERSSKCLQLTYSMADTYKRLLNEVPLLQVSVDPKSNRLQLLEPFTNWSGSDIQGAQVRSPSIIPNSHLQIAVRSVKRYDSTCKCFTRDTTVAMHQLGPPSQRHPACICACLPAPHAGRCRCRC